MEPKKQISYRQAGVDIDEADRAVGLIKVRARETFTKGVLTDIGAFGAGYLLRGWKQPVLISSADGVGTKLKIAFMTGRHDTIGEDLVNHCVNDIAVQGAVPLFFLDYFAVGKLDAEVADQVVSGMARGCKNARCALIGGETAEMPGLYQPGEYDLAGFIVGGVERKEMITGAKVKPGDVLIGLASTGLHTNGYSLARKLLFEVARRELDGDLADTLLKVHRSYLQPLQTLLKAGVLKAAAHITGGGIPGNLPRVLPEGTAAQVDASSWPVPPIFEELRGIGDIPLDDYRRTFNLGIGMILIVSPKKLKKATQFLDELGEKSYRIGSIVESPVRQVVYV